MASPINSSDSPTPPLAPPASVLTVLVVEDEKMVRELTKRILQGAGMRVLEASDAEEALQHISDDIDILLTDVVLPSMSGPELVARCRGRAHQFRVVYMSGYPADFVESRVTLQARDVLVQKHCGRAAARAPGRSARALVMRPDARIDTARNTLKLR